jgi:hypothetical protein
LVLKSLVNLACEIPIAWLGSAVPGIISRSLLVCLVLPIQNGDVAKRKQFEAGAALEDQDQLLSTHTPVLQKERL